MPGTDCTSSFAPASSAVASLVVYARAPSDVRLVNGLPGRSQNAASQGSTSVELHPQPGAVLRSPRLVLLLSSSTGALLPVLEAAGCAIAP